MFVENLDVYLADFGVTAEVRGTCAQVIFDVRDEDILGGRASSTAYLMTFRSTDLPGIAFGDWATVDGIDYQVKSVERLDDGKFSSAALQRNAVYA